MRRLIATGIAAAAAMPANAAKPSPLVSNERKNSHVVSAHHGIMALLALYFSA